MAFETKKVKPSPQPVDKYIKLKEDLERRIVKVSERLNALISLKDQYELYIERHMDELVKADNLVRAIKNELTWDEESDG
jgi:hypothetical protein